MAKKSEKNLKPEEEKQILDMLSNMKRELEDIGKNLEEMIEGLKNRNFSINQLKDISIVINARDINDPLLKKAILRLRRI
jgi:hypothetical protein